MGPPNATEMDAVVAMTAVSDMNQARALARLLVDSRFAACVSLTEGIRSVYHWKGETVEEPEIVLLIKTRRGLLPRLREAVSGHHPYEIPELIALPVIDCLPGYLAWLRESTENPDAEVQ
jgi:periplasmic divalent cation tolerance protein